MKENINFLIERNSILNTNFFCDIVVVIALIIVACICVVRRQKLKEREYTKKIRKRIYKENQVDNVLFIFYRYVCYYMSINYYADDKALKTDS